jgi:hypothetical protein
MERVSSAIEPRTIGKVVGKDGAIFYSVSGNGVDWAGSQRGWVIDLTSNDGVTDLLLGERVTQPPQKASTRTVLFGAVAPALSAAACTSSTGTGANFLFPVETGVSPTYKLFDVNGDTLFNDSDPYVAGYATKADGIDSIIKSTTGSMTASDGACAPGFQRVSIQNTTGQVSACLEIPPPPPPPICDPLINPTCPPGGSGGSVITDRIWRRIINPPIR